MKIDCLLGVHLYTNCPTDEMRELLDEEHAFEIVPSCALLQQETTSWHSNMAIFISGQSAAMA